MSYIDIDFVRSQFPAFQSNALREHAFFENAGGSYSCQQVISRLERFYTHRKTQPYGAYNASALAGAEMDEANTRLSSILGLDNTHMHLSFGPSTTQNTYVLAQAFQEILKPGDAIIVTNQDHEANNGCWRRLEKAGILIYEWQMSPQGSLTKSALLSLLDDKVRLVCFPHCSNIVGEINDAKDLCAIIRNAGAYSCVDGVSFAPHGLPNIGAIGADIYLFSTYKTFSTHQGVMAISDDLLHLLPNQGHFFNASSYMKKLTPAGPDHAQIAACAGLADYMELLMHHHIVEHDDVKINAIGQHKKSSTGITDALYLTKRIAKLNTLLRAHETYLLEMLLPVLNDTKKAQLLGTKSPNLRAPTLSLHTKEHPKKLAKALAEKNIMAGASDFYAYRTLHAFGIDPKRGVLRLSFVHYTHEHEIKKLINALDAIL